MPIVGLRTVSGQETRPTPEWCTGRLPVLSDVRGKGVYEGPTWRETEETVGLQE